MFRSGNIRYRNIILSLGILANLYIHPKWIYPVDLPFHCGLGITTENVLKYALALQALEYNE